jgi:hypothetical protein
MKQKILNFPTAEMEPVDSRPGAAKDPEKGVVKEVGKKTTLEKPLAVYIDGPFGSPSSNIYRQGDFFL